ncbi:MAG: DUF2062 domain-containing protein [Novosphingobium sp.]
MTRRLAAWLKARVPDRDRLARSRFLRPFAGSILRSDLWRFTRRSVPRGVALGIFVGLLLPFAHAVVAALAAPFVGANVPVAIVTTFANNPITWVIIFPTAYEIGRFLLHIDAMTGFQPISGTMQTTQTDHLLQQVTGAGIDTALGLFVMACTLSALGYVVSGMVWRALVARKRRSRLAQAREGVPL